MTAPSRPRFMQRISSKLIGVVVVTLIGVLGASMSAVSWIVWKDFYKNAEAVSLASVDRARDVATAYVDAALASSRREFVLFKSRYEGGEFELIDGSLRWKGQPLNGDTSGVDAFKRETGGSVATLFAREGDDFRRITTSLLRQDGQRAVGTLLDRNHPAYPLMAKGERYAGTAMLFGRPYMTVYEPIRAGNETIGIVFTGTDISADLTRVLSGLRDIRLGETGRVYAVDLRPGAQQGAMMGLDDPAARVDLNSSEGKAWFDAVAAVSTQAELHPTWSPLASGQGPMGRFLGVARLNELGWALVSDAPAQEMMQSARHALTFLWLGVVGAMLLLAAVLARAIAVVVVRPIGGLTGALGYLSNGDLTHPIASRSDDEVGHLSKDMERFRLALRDSLLQVRHSADVVSQSSREIADGNNDLSHRTESQASALEQTAASMEQMGATVQHNADNATEAHQLASQATTVAQRGGERVSDVVTSMKAIHNSSQKIADIIGVIDGIAFQTNILALNAAVEAARAGEQGRGFAVVAGEVRILAQRSASAAKEIKTLIGQSVEEVRLGTVQVDQARATMDDVVVSIRRLAQTIAEISAASREQSEGVSQVGEAVVRLDQTTQQNAALVEEMAAATGSLSSQAQQLVDVVARFHLEDGQMASARGAVAWRAQERATIGLNQPLKVGRLPG